MSAELVLKLLHQRELCWAGIHFLQLIAGSLIQLGTFHYFDSVLFQLKEGHCFPIIPASLYKKRFSMGHT